MRRVSTTAKNKIVYSEKYKRGAAMIKERSLPVLKHANDAEVISAELLEAGKLKDGTEYQILRVELRPK